MREPINGRVFGHNAQHNSGEDNDAHGRASTDSAAASGGSGHASRLGATVGTTEKRLRQANARNGNHTSWWQRLGAKFGR